MIRGSPNGETRSDDKSEHLGFLPRGEPAEVKHLSKRRKRNKVLRFAQNHSLSSGERKGKSPNLNKFLLRGCKKITSGAFRVHWNVCRGRAFRQRLVSRNTLERGTIEGNSPVGENPFALLVIFLEYSEKRKSRRKQAGLPAKAKYVRLTDSELVP